MRYFLLFFLVLSFQSHSRPSFDDACPHGYGTVNSYGMQTGNACSSGAWPSDDRIVKVENMREIQKPWGKVQACDVYYLMKTECASVHDDDAQEDGCYPKDSLGSGYCKETKECPGGFNIPSDASCSEYCRGPSPFDPSSGAPIHKCTGTEGEEPLGGPDNPDDNPGNGSERENDEQQCGIGQRKVDGSCQPIPDNCGYINGSYQCANPEPPSGCGSIKGPNGEIVGCFEEKEGCGYFGDTYGCFDSDDSTDCQGGWLINGVCNKDGEQEPSCPIGYVYDNGCKNAVTKCPIGYSMSQFGGGCERDDCPIGKYMAPGGMCLDIPPDPGPDYPGNPNNPDLPGSGDPNNPDPNNPGDGDGDGGDGDGNPSNPDSGDTDLSSVNKRLDKINKSIQTADANNTNELNELNLSNKNLLAEAEGIHEKLDDVFDEDAGAMTPEGFASLEEQVDAKRTQYMEKLAEYRDKFSDLFDFNPGSGGSPFYDDNVTVMGVDINFGTSRFEPFLAFLPALIIFAATCYAAFLVMSGGSK